MRILWQIIVDKKVNFAFDFNSWVTFAKHAKQNHLSDLLVNDYVSINDLYARINNFKILISWFFKWW